MGTVVLVSTVVAGAIAGPAGGVPPARSPPPFRVGAGPAGYSWSNGLVALGFGNASPSYSVASVANASVSVQQTLSGLAEVSAQGGIRSFASFLAPGVRWSVVPVVASASTTVVLNSSVPVLGSSGEWESGDDGNGSQVLLGNATVGITFWVNASSGTDPSTVAYSLNVSGWPWLNSSDTLGVQVRSNLSAANGYWQPGGLTSVNGFSRLTNAPLAEFSWGQTAQVQYQNRTEDQSAVGAYHNFSGNYASSLVRLSFGAVQGNYSHLSYDPALAIVAPTGAVAALAAVVLNPMTISGLVAGTMVAAGLAYVARKRRVPPETGL